MWLPAFQRTILLLGEGALSVTVAQYQGCLGILGPVARLLGGGVPVLAGQDAEVLQVEENGRLGSQHWVGNEVAADRSDAAMAETLLYLATGPEKPLLCYIEVPMGRQVPAGNLRLHGTQRLQELAPRDVQTQTRPRLMCLPLGLPCIHDGAFPDPEVLVWNGC